MNIERFYKAPITQFVMVFYFLLGIVALYNNITGSAVLIGQGVSLANAMMALALPLLYLGGKITFGRAPMWVSHAIMYVVIAMMLLSILLSSQGNV